MGYGKYLARYDVDRIIRAATRLGLSQRVLAERAGISPVTVSRIVHGHRQPTPDTIRALARVVGLDAESLVKGVQPARVR